MESSKNKEIINNDNLINKYIESLTEKERITLEIAKEYLETSFNLKKSIGFTKWLKKNKPN